jgi:hypothetical protein
VITKGEAAQPHTEQELTGKFFELGEPVWGTALTHQLYAGLIKLETLADFGAFAKTLSL